MAKKNSPEVENETPEQEPVREVKNGLKRPKPTSICGQVWAICDEIVGRTGAMPRRRDVLAKAAIMKLSASTASTQLHSWKIWNGFMGLNIPIPDMKMPKIEMPKPPAKKPHGKLKGSEKLPKPPAKKPVKKTVKKAVAEPAPQPSIALEMGPDSSIEDVIVPADPIETTESEAEQTA